METQEVTLLPLQQLLERTEKLKIEHVEIRKSQRETKERLERLTQTIQACQYGIRVAETRIQVLRGLEGIKTMLDRSLY